MKTGNALAVRAIFVAGILAVSACSVADYKKPVTDMAGAVQDSIATIEKLDKHMTDERNADWRAALSANRAQLNPVDKTCAADASNCVLEILFSDGKTAPFPATSVLPKARAGLIGLQHYVANLKAIIDADTVNQVTTSANAALGSLKNAEESIAEATGEPSSGVVARFQEPASSAITWLVGQYVDYVKVKALKKATKRAQPIIQKLSELYQTVADAVATHVLADATKKFIQAQSTFDSISDSGAAPTADQISAYVAAAQTYDTALNAKKAEPIKVFAEAHAALNGQLNGDVSLSDAMAAIENLVERAKAFKAIVDAFEKA